MGTHGPSTPTEPGFAGLRVRLESLRPRAWLVFLVIGLGVAVAATLVGNRQAMVPALTALGLSSSAAILIGIRANRPAHPLPWYLLAITMLITTIAGTLDATAMGLAASQPGPDRHRVPDRHRRVGPADPRPDPRRRPRSAPRRGDPRDRDRRPDLGVRLRVPSCRRPRRARWRRPPSSTPRSSPSRWSPGCGSCAGAASPRDATHRAVRPRVERGHLRRHAQGPRRPRGLRGAVPARRSSPSSRFVGAAALHPSMAIVAGAPARRPRADRPPPDRRPRRGPAGQSGDPGDRGRRWAAQIDPAPYLIGGVVIGVLVIARLGDALRQLGESLHERESLMELLRRQALYDTLTSLPNRSLFTERLAADFANRSDRPACWRSCSSTSTTSRPSTTPTATRPATPSWSRSASGCGAPSATATRRRGSAATSSSSPCRPAPTRSSPIRVAERVLAALERAVRRRRAQAHRPRQHRRRRRRRRRPDRRRARPQRRHRDVPRQEPRQGPRSRSSSRRCTRPRTPSSSSGPTWPRGSPRATCGSTTSRSSTSRTGKTVGFEALVRWMRDGRLVPPGEFIPMAESSGLIGPLTDWVVDEACRTTAAWGTPGDASVGQRQPLVEPARPPGHRRAASARASRPAAWPPERLVIEITESRSSRSTSPGRPSNA